MEHEDVVGRRTHSYAVLARDNGSERLMRLYDTMAGLYISLGTARRFWKVGIVLPS